MKTDTLKQSQIKRAWHLVNLDGQNLGRSAVTIAKILMGKSKVLTGAHLDQGDYVVAINASKITVTGKKLSDKKYYSHSGFPGGFKEITLQELLAKDPVKVIEKAVKGMLPKDKHSEPRLRRLKVFSSDQHPYQQELGLNKISK